MLITFYTIAVCDVKRLLVQFQARWCPATVTPSSVRLTPGTVASVSLPWSTCPTTKCSTWWVSSTQSSHPSSSRPERSRTPGPTWTHTQASSSSTTEWRRWTITQSYSVSAELWVSWVSSTHIPPLVFPRPAILKVKGTQKYQFHTLTWKKSGIHESRTRLRLTGRASEKWICRVKGAEIRHAVAFFGGLYGLALNFCFRIEKLF